MDGFVDALLVLNNTPVKLCGGRAGATLRQATGIAFDRCDIDPNVFPELAERGRLGYIGLTDCTLGGQKLGDAILDSVLGFPELQQLRIGNCGVTAAVERLFGYCPKLSVLELMKEPKVDDRIIAVAAQFPELATLALNDSGLQNPDLGLLNGLRSLSEVSLDRTKVLDHSVLQLRNPYVFDLSLVGTQVTEAVLAVIDGCPGLHHIWVSPGVVSPAAVERFQVQHPNCRVDVDEAPHIAKDGA